MHVAAVDVGLTGDGQMQCVLEVNWFFFVFVLITGGSLVDPKGSCSSLQGSSRL